MNPSPPSSTLDPAAPVAASKEIISQSEIERLLAQVESVDPSAARPEPQDTAHPAGREIVSRHEFPALSIFSPAELRPLRVRHEEFITLLATRLSLHLGLEVGLQMSKLEAMPFQRFADGLSNPTYLTMVKLQPLAGACLLDIPPRLGLSIVDRELGGPGRATEELRQIGKIEARLLAPVVSLIINEWCGIWSDLMEVRPTVLGFESNSRDIRTCALSTSMLVVGVEAHLAEAVEQIQFAFPHPMLEPLSLKLNSGANGGEKQNAAAKATPAKWNPIFDELQIQVKAELPEIELPAGDVAELKPGDVLTLPQDWMNQVRLRLANHPGYIGTLGVSDQRRAIKIEKCLKG